MTRDRRRTPGAPLGGLLADAALDVVDPVVDRALRAVAGARTRGAVALRAKVAADDPAEADRAADAIWGARGERWFGPDDPVWVVHGSSAMFAGGIRALLLQSLHPLAMAGVAGHSGYRGDPWGRLQRTSHYIAMTTYGTVPDALATIETVRRVHERVRGKAPDGRPYAASDPHLLRWVHVAEIDSFLTAYRRLGANRLSAAEQDGYVEQAGRAAALLGVVDPPRTVAELEAELAAYRPELEATDAARDAADFLLRHPPLSRGAYAGYALLAAGAVATLPDDARRMLGLPRLSVPGLLAGRVAVRGVEWLLDDPAVANDRRITAALSAS